MPAIYDRCVCCKSTTSTLRVLVTRPVPPRGDALYVCDPPCPERLENVKRREAYEKKRAKRGAR